MTDHLLKELSGILNWAIDGWQRLTTRRRFIQPVSAKELVDELLNLSSPVSEFIREWYIRDPKGEIRCDTVFAHWRLWCEAQGREHPGTAQSLGRDLRAAIPGLSIVRHDQDRHYVGIRLPLPTDQET